MQREKEETRSFGARGGCRMERERRGERESKTRVSLCLAGTMAGIDCESIGSAARELLLAFANVLRFGRRRHDPCNRR